MRGVTGGPVPPWSGARVRKPGHRPGASGTIKGVDVQLTSPSRRVFGFLAAGTIGLSTALLGVTGVAQADPGRDRGAGRRR